MKENNSNLIDDGEEEEKEIEPNPSNLDDMSSRRINEVNKNNPLCFKVPSKEEVIKVDNCSFINEVKKISTFYFCSCSKEEFYPICEACANQCHHAHNPTQTIQGIYICKCGECNHLITDENENMFKERKKTHGRLCFYAKLMEVSPGQGYYKYKEITHCGVCIRKFRKG